MLTALAHVQAASSSGTLGAFLPVHVGSLDGSVGARTCVGDERFGRAPAARAGAAQAGRLCDTVNAASRRGHGSELSTSLSPSGGRESGAAFALAAGARPRGRDA